MKAIDGNMEYTHKQANV